MGSFVFEESKQVSVNGDIKYFVYIVLEWKRVINESLKNSYFLNVYLLYNRN